MHYFRDGMGMTWLWIIGFFLLVLIGLLIYALVRQIQTSNRPDHSDRGTQEALEILRKRYAQGEISEEEYLRRKKILEDDHGNI
ncbi:MULTISPECIES: SHOCT domain-containing protein [unclassified Jeotgalibaca]|uniref:SHOCT domain-containing protein n=1 Tax=unclassified Jeotgalibaca TaxID=2621505 RepID=UPI003FD11BB9